MGDPEEIDPAAFERERREFQRRLNNKSSNNKRRDPPAPARDAAAGPWRTPRGPAAPAGPTSDELRAFQRGRAAVPFGQRRGTPRRPPSDSPSEIANTTDNAGNGYSDPVESSTLHVAQERDHLGRSYIDAPGELPAALPAPGCRPPRGRAHTYADAHRGGALSVALQPRVGRLLLSSGGDGVARIWRASDDHALLRSFDGHAGRPLRDAIFSADNDGRQIATAGDDGRVRLWDTESGALLLRTQRAGSGLLCLAFHPHSSSVLLAGTADRRVLQWDLRTPHTAAAAGDPAPSLEYTGHLGPVASVAFIPPPARAPAAARFGPTGPGLPPARFLTTSDDRTVRVWDWDVPVAPRSITSAEMHAMPRTAVHPTEASVALQAMDSRILVYSTAGRVEPRPRRPFVGHHVAGFACRPAISPDGALIASGDGRGHVLVWDWRSANILAHFGAERSVPAHARAAVCAVWHPTDPSSLYTCSWDGSIIHWR